MVDGLFTGVESPVVDGKVPSGASFYGRARVLDGLS
jgi:hypothetical protein